VNVRHILRPVAGSVLLLVLLAVPSRHLYGQTEVVRVVLFFSPMCPHCHEVIQNHLPIFFDIYGGEPSLWTDESISADERSLYLMYNEQLEILLIDVTRPLGGELFIADLESHGIPPEQGSVPRMVFGDDILIGSIEIPSRFHGLMRQAVADGGLDWPPIPGLATVVARLPTATVAAADSEVVAPAPSPDRAAESEVTTATDTVVRTEAPPEPEVPPVAADTDTSPEPVPVVESDTVDSTVDSASNVSPPPDTAANPFDVVPRTRPTLVENLQRDPVGNTLSVIILLGMVASVVVITVTKWLQNQWSRPPAAILLVAALGIVVAGYLSYVETSGATAVCGPVGDCNTVQQSRYAVLFGLFPVGLLGLLTYIAIIVMWLMTRFGSRLVADYAGLLLLVTAFVGTLFSIYLTFLEPFVIGATCAWCLTSAVAVTLLLWLSASSGKAAWARLGERWSSGKDLQ
jgi:uncharacterized membrane protein